jgi:hypothetical protein
MKRFLDRFSLGIEHAIFKRNENFNPHHCLHASIGLFLLANGSPQLLLKNPTEDKINVRQMLAHAPSSLDFLGR